MPPSINITCALRRREVQGTPRTLRFAKRMYWNFSDIMPVEEHQAVLLGFSNNGRYLMYYEAQDNGIHIFWREFRPFQTPLVSLHKTMDIVIHTSISTTFQDIHHVDDDMEVRVWELHDDSLVLAIANAREACTNCASCFVSIAPGLARHQSLLDLRELQFTISTTTAPSQCWFFISSTFQLAFHLGSSFVLLSLAFEPSAAFRPESTPWYYPSDYPIEMNNSGEIKVPSRQKLRLQCVHQTTFDVECFLRSLLDSYATLRQFHLQDYELKFLCLSESTWIYVCGVMDLDRYDNPCRSRMGFFFAWNAKDGMYKLIRLLTLPNRFSIKDAINKLEQHCKRMLSRHVSPSRDFTMWSNEGVLRGESLHILENPIYPYGIRRQPE